MAQEQTQETTSQSFPIFYNPLLTNYHVTPNDMQTNTNVWFLNELLSSPRFWSTVRKFVGLNQTRFSKELGVSRNAVSNWETETCIPTRGHTIRAQVILEKHLQRTLAKMREKMETEFEEAAAV